MTTVFARCTHHPSYAHMTPYSARAMLDTDVVVLAKGCFASSENDPAREREREREGRWMHGYTSGYHGTIIMKVTLIS